MNALRPLSLLLALLLLLGACGKTEETPRPEPHDYGTVQFLQKQPIRVSETVTIRAEKYSGYKLLENSHPQVAEVRATPQGFEVHGRQQGMALLHFRHPETKDNLWFRIAISGDGEPWPIHLFAPHNVASDGTSLVGSPKIPSGLFSYDAATEIKISYQGHTYRLPTQREIEGLIPISKLQRLLSREVTSLTIDEELTIGGKTKIYSSTFKYWAGSPFMTAIRFARSDQRGSAYAEDNSQLSVFVYELRAQRPVPVLHIKARYLGPQHDEQLFPTWVGSYLSEFPWEDRTLDLPIDGANHGIDGRYSRQPEVGDYWGRGTTEAFVLPTMSLFLPRWTPSTDLSLRRPVRLIRAD